MQRFYSPTSDGFFSEDVHGARMLEWGDPPSPIPNPECTIPADAIPVDDQLWHELLLATSEGAQIAVVDGAVTAIPVAAAPDEEEG